MPRDSRYTSGSSTNFGGGTETMRLSYSIDRKDIESAAKAFGDMASKIEVAATSLGNFNRTMDGLSSASGSILALGSSLEKMVAQSGGLDAIRKSLKSLSAVANGLESKNVSFSASLDSKKLTSEIENLNKTVAQDNVLDKEVSFTTNTAKFDAEFKRVQEATIDPKAVKFDASKLKLDDIKIKNIDLDEKTVAKIKRQVQQKFDDGLTVTTISVKDSAVNKLITQVNQALNANLKQFNVNVNANVKQAQPGTPGGGSGKTHVTQSLDVTTNRSVNLTGKTINAKGTNFSFMGNARITAAKDLVISAKRVILNNAGKGTGQQGGQGGQGAGGAQGGAPGAPGTPSAPGGIVLPPPMPKDGNLSDLERHKKKQASKDYAPPTSEKVIEGGAKAAMAAGGWLAARIANDKSEQILSQSIDYYREPGQAGTTPSHMLGNSREALINSTMQDINIAGIGNEDKSKLAAIFQKQSFGIYENTPRLGDINEQNKGEVEKNLTEKMTIARKTADAMGIPIDQMAEMMGDLGSSMNYTNKELAGMANIMDIAKKSTSLNTQEILKATAASKSWSILLGQSGDDALQTQAKWTAALDQYKRMDIGVEKGAEMSKAGMSGREEGIIGSMLLGITPGDLNNPEAMLAKQRAGATQIGNVAQGYDPRLQMMIYSKMGELYGGNLGGPEEIAKLIRGDKTGVADKSKTSSDTLANATKQTAENLLTVVPATEKVKRAFEHIYQWIYDVVPETQKGREVASIGTGAFMGGAIGNVIMPGAGKFIGALLGGLGMTGANAVNKHDGGVIPGFNSGGKVVPGTFNDKDSVLAMLTPGEVVLPEHQAKNFFKKKQNVLPSAEDIMKEATKYVYGGMEKSSVSTGQNFTPDRNAIAKVATDTKVSTSPSVDIQKNREYTANFIKELEAIGAIRTSDYRGPDHDLYNPKSYHSKGLAVDISAKTRTGEHWSRSDKFQKLSQLAQQSGFSMLHEMPGQYNAGTGSKATGEHYHFEYKTDRNPSIASRQKEEKPAAPSIVTPSSSENRVATGSATPPIPSMSSDKAQDVEGFNQAVQLFMKAAEMMVRSSQVTPQMKSDYGTGALAGGFPINRGV